MSLKWTTLAAVVSAVTLSATGLALGDDENSPVHKLMTQVSAKDRAIKKVTKTAAGYKKGQKDLGKLADDLIDLGKQSRELKNSAEKEKKPFADWQKLCDDFVTKTEAFKGSVADASVTQEAAKKAYAPVAASCTNCHAVFRPEE